MFRGDAAARCCRSDRDGATTEGDQAAPRTPSPGPACAWISTVSALPGFPPSRGAHGPRTLAPPVETIAARVAHAARTIVPMQPTIVDAEEAHRYEARVDGDLAGFIDYIVKRGRIALIHTEVLPGREGQGIGRDLVRFALDDARRRELPVIASCPYVRAYVERHPETHDIVVGMTAV
jgi:predicted GNAT family acetyltransferase